MASLLSPPRLPILSSRLTPSISRNPHHVLSPLKPSRGRSPSNRSLHVSLALAESEPPKPTAADAEDALPLLRELAECFALPSDYFAKLPRDLRLDLNDAAFDLSSGPVIDQCGRELGEKLSNLARAWEQGDTSTSCSIVSELPTLHESLTDNAKSAFGKRLVSAGRRFEAMGQYGQGELQKIATTMIKAGKVLSARPVSVMAEQPKTETRMLKFGDLQVELTPEKAYIGAGIGFAFGLLSWGLTQGMQNVNENSVQYANDNAKSLRGALLALGYSSTLLSMLASVGLVVLGRQLSSSDET